VHMACTRQQRLLTRSLIHRAGIAPGHPAMPPPRYMGCIRQCLGRSLDPDRSRLQQREVQQQDVCGRYVRAWQGGV
jgi:hypothetical protein